jgi:galactokinase
MRSALRDKFHAAFGRQPEIIACAPGRIEFIGNHTDYNGGTVLGAAIDRGVWVALARRDDGRRRFASDHRAEAVTLVADSLEKLSGEKNWVNYPLGIVAIMAEAGLAVPSGFDYFVTSNLPSGAGLSSSAAIELASGLAFLAATKQSLSPEELVRLARRAENDFVGVPCGILDQGVSAFGKKDRLVLIDCRRPSFATVPLPSGVNFWIFNTHIRHALVDGLYAARHRECMAAAAALGVGQLADVTPERWADVSDAFDVTLAKRAHHVFGEIARVAAAAAGLRAGNLVEVGRLLTASHRSSQRFFENSTAELDFLVDVLERARHVFGARLTGGGFGGAVMAMTTESFAESDAQIVADAYAKKFGAAPEIFQLQTADGAKLLLG